MDSKNNNNKAAIAASTYEIGRSDSDSDNSTVNSSQKIDSSEQVVPTDSEKYFATVRSSESLSVSSQKPQYFSSKLHEWAFIFTCLMGQLLNQAGTTQSMSIMNIIAEDFGSETSKQAWLFASFPLVSGSFILVGGRFGDIYGLKKMLLLGYAILTIWSIICGLTHYTHSDDFFIVAKAFQGLGVSFILPNIIGLVGTIYEPGSMKKNITISFIGAMAPLGATFGGLFSGIVVVKDDKNWPWTFYAFAIVSFLVGVTCYFFVPDNVPTNTNNLKMDWIGSAVGVVGLLLFSFVWNQAPMDGWDKAYIIVLLVISVILIIAFFIYEINYAEVPLLPKAITGNRHIIMILLAIFMGWGTFGIWSFYYFSFSLNLRHFSPVWTGGAYFAFILSGFTIASCVGFLIKIIRPSIILVISITGFTMGNLIFAVTPADQTYWRNTFGMMLLLPLGMDLSFPASSIILSDQLPPEYQGMAGSLVNTMVNYSQSFCLGVATTVEKQINSSGDDLLKGYRAAFYTGVGIGTLGISIASLYMFETFWTDYKEKTKLANDIESSIERTG
ncbi:hypothetical protein TPHA_0C04790 [Tetrapisispora phaffii CBS 4417]|uniref:Major facilitator superfamily (MFS) profile domain-containing protein n=1 Tax=Tetrapisispora phaffii (strain ATCC 24235 / CBS 4417 / NBRC 1672 / NRRL Y-8282 / UCD 70-5) TaxID=1071381 RepID=G8BQW6_TETPH|nr:hypothetical protein TPHA_0C04790 [Tetrapisispora phaffii CBS 4417]CCE62628.1 hypothetical protein TPHA_0C04790 [Tetrapisispora phaffii CBS 4417]